MAKKKDFKLDEPGKSTIEQLMNYNATTGSDAKTLELNEVDQATQEAIQSKLENYSRHVMLMMKPSEHAELKEIAWRNRMSVNAYINKVLRESIEREKAENE